jgi:hypothetical protein
MPDSAFKYANLYANTVYENYNQTNAETMIQMSRLFDYSVEQKIAQEENAKSEQKGRWIGLLVIAVLSALSLLLYVFYKKAKKEKQLSQLHIQHLNLKNELLVAQNTLHVLQKQKEELEVKLNEQNIKVHSLLQIQMEETEQKLQQQYAYIETLQRTLGKYETHVRQLKDENVSSAEDITRQSGSYEQARRQLSESIRQPGSNGVSEQVWETFITASQNAYPITANLLKEVRELSSDEYRVALLVMAEFKPSTIEVFMNKTSGYATKVRKRLLKKVFCQKGKADDFDVLLKRFRRENDVRQFSVSH